MLMCIKNVLCDTDACAKGNVIQKFTYDLQFLLVISAGVTEMALTYVA